MTTATAGRDFTHLPPYRDARTRSERHRDEDHSDHRRRRLRPPIPDMRFEHIYIRSVKPYIHVEDAPNVEGDRAVKTVAGAGSGEVVRVQWGHVLLVTLRDQILSPLVQGILWGVVGTYLRPTLAVFGLRLRRWWASGGTYARARKVDGHGVSVLRSWVSSIVPANPKGVVLK